MDQMGIEMAYKIIIEEVSSEIAFNIMDINSLKNMWDTLGEFNQKLAKV